MYNSRWLILFMIFISSGCLPAKPKALVFANAATKTAASASSLEAFSKTVYPIVQQNCVQCHRASISPFFAHDDIKEAHSNILTAFKVNLTTPEDSRIYKRLKYDLHNCWGDCASNGEEMLNAIKIWADATKKGRVETGIKTEAKLFSTAQLLITSLQDLTVFEAEDAISAGRSELLISQSASGLRGITTTKVASHPLGSINTRYGELTTGCRTDIAAGEFTGPSTLRPYRVFNKIERHPDANGYQPYYLDIQFTFIRPDKRTEYFNLLKTKGTLTAEELAPFAWKRGGFIGAPGTASPMKGYGIEYNSITPFGYPVSSTVGGRNTRGATPIFLPDGLSLEEYRVMRDAGTLPADYFAPRFNNFYYSADNKEIRKHFSRLQLSQQFIQKAVYFPVAMTVLNYMFVQPSPTVAKDSVEADRSGLSYFTSNLGSAAFTDTFDLNYNDAGTVIYTDPNDPQNVFHNIDRYVYIEGKTNNVKFANILKQDIRYTPPDPTNKTILATLEDYSAAIFQPSHLTDSMSLWKALTGPVVPPPQPYDMNNVVYPNKDMDKDLESFSFSKFSGTIHPIVASSTNTCINCHAGQTTAAPAFAVANSSASYSVLKGIQGFNLDDPTASVLHQKMVSDHSGTLRCGTSTKCAALAADFLANISTWSQDFNNKKIELSASSTFVKAFTQLEQTPGTMKLKFNIKETGKYKFLARVKRTDTGAGSDNFFNYNVINSNNAAVPLTKAGPVVETLEVTTCNKPLFASSTAWSWVTSGDKYYILAPGDYTLQVFEGRDGIEFDQIGFTKNLALLPNPNSINSVKPTFNKFEFDVAALTGIPNAKFVMTVADYYGYYKISNTHFVASEDIWVKDIQVMVNNFANPNDATLRTVAKVNTAGVTTPLSTSPLMVLKQNGSGSDKISILFKELRKARPEDTAALALDDRTGERICRDTVFFEQNVMPVLTKLQIWAARYVGSNYDTRFNKRSPLSLDRKHIEYETGQQNHCISCHAASVPAFKMAATATELCLEVIKRVNFDDPENSTIFRGINGQLGHQPIVTPERPVVDTNGNWLNDPDSWNGKKSEWVTGSRFKIYATYDDLFNPNGLCPPPPSTNTAEIAYLKKFIGTYKRLQLVLFTGGTAVHQVYTNHDKFLEGSGGAFLQTTDYPGAFTELQRRSVTKPFYPGDYSCASTPIALTRRLAPQSINMNYPDNDISSGPNSAVFPDGKFIRQKNGINNTQSSSLMIVLDHDFDDTIPTPDWTDSKNEIRKILMKWIEREKVLRDAATP